jgi:hypothetical protein
VGVVASEGGEGLVRGGEGREVGAGVIPAWGEGDGHVLFVEERSVEDRRGGAGKEIDGGGTGERERLAIVGFFSWRLWSTGSQGGRGDGGGRGGVGGAVLRPEEGRAPELGREAR